MPGERSWLKGCTAASSFDYRCTVDTGSIGSIEIDRLMLIVSKSPVLNIHQPNHKPLFVQQGDGWIGGEVSAISHTTELLATSRPPITHQHIIQQVIDWHTEYELICTYIICTSQYAYNAYLRVVSVCSTHNMLSIHTYILRAYLVRLIIIYSPSMYTTSTTSSQHRFYIYL